MKTKAEKRNEAKKNAELAKSQKKVQRDTKKGVSVVSAKPGKKGTSAVPQAKKK